MVVIVSGQEKEIAIHVKEKDAEEEEIVIAVKEKGAEERESAVDVKDAIVNHIHGQFHVMAVL